MENEIRFNTENDDSETERKILPLTEEECAFFLSREGPLASENELYEERPSQLALVRAVSKAFNEEKIAAFEAGTGVGKSFAYIIPALLWCARNRERVVISTGTINLQQQLYEKDIPLAKKITGLNVKSVLVKGRNNYVCLRRLSEAGKERDLFSDDTETLDSISEWAKTTPTGSISDLSFMPSDSVWSRVNSESDACMGGRCRFHEKCFVMKMRKEASEAPLLVVNHHLLFADIESRMSGIGYEDAAVLPPYSRIVFDEAHGMEESATSFFSSSVTKFRLTKQLNLLYRSGRGAKSGFLVQADTVVNGEETFLQEVSAMTEDVKENAALLDECARTVLDTSMSMRLHRGNLRKFSRVLDAMKKLKLSLDAFTSRVRDVFENNIAEDDKNIQSVWESKNIIRRLEDTSLLFASFLSMEEHDDMVFWCEKCRLPPKKAGDDFTVYVKFTQTPIDIAPLMNSGVFEPMKTVICTSATLRTSSSFAYWMRRTGVSFIEDERIICGDFASPFPYEKNVLFAVPNDAPFPESPYFQNYVEETLPRLIKASGGKTLVLFTSYDSLRNAAKNCALSLSREGIPLMKQGDDDRFRLMSRFKEEKESVLFATESFWEGVDVPGESLSQVIIVKLPFAVPNDPVFEARSEMVEKRGGSSFMELSVPRAVIKFRQGFGRLMRRCDDRGDIVVLDRRIVEKQYGRIFTTSVPKTRRMYNPTDYIAGEIQKMFS